VINKGRVLVEALVLTHAVLLVACRTTRVGLERHLC
jgi:hypothetical protein